MNRHLKSASCLLLVVLAACVDEESHVEVQQSQPARCALPGVHSIAVLPADGPGGTLISDSLSFALMARSYLRVVSQADVSAQLGARATAYITSYELALLADRLHVDALVVPEVHELDVVETYDWRQDTSAFGKPQTTYKRHLDMPMKVGVRIIGRDGLPLHETTLDASQFAVDAGTVVLDGPPCGEEYLAQFFPPVDAMGHVSESCAIMAARFVSDLQPGRIANAVVLITDARVPESMQAYARAVSGEWTQSAVIFRALVDCANRSAGREVRAAAYYNWGVALTYAGDYDMAAYALSESSRLTRRDRLNALVAEAQTTLERECAAHSQGDRLGWSEVE